VSETVSPAGAVRPEHSIAAAATGREPQPRPFVATRRPRACSSAG